MKFSDLVMVVASMAVVFVLIVLPLELVWYSALGISAMSDWGYLANLIICLFLSALINGYIFAGKIWEARRESIVKIAVLWAGLMMLIAMIVPASNAEWGQAVKDDFLASNPGATLSTSEWLTWNYMYLDVFTFIMVGIALVLGFIGLYVGSMLRPPEKKS